jgi:ribonuclease BN (tRNA processing enzyme)
MARVRLTVIGSSPAWPNPGAAHSGYLVEGAGPLLLDCGPGVLARLCANGGWPAVDAVVLTHFHLDHCGDLVPWVWGSSHHARQGARPPRPQLLIPPGGRERLERFGALFGAPEMFGWAFEIEEYPEGRAFEAAGHSVTAVRVPHFEAEAFALRVSGAGTVLAYSGDSAPCDQLAGIARDADLFVCEATLLSGEHDGNPRGHLSFDEAEGLFERAGAERLLVTHRPSDLPPPPRHELAHDGLVIEL